VKVIIIALVPAQKDEEVRREAGLTSTRWMWTERKSSCGICQGIQPAKMGNLDALAIDRRRPLAMGGYLLDNVFKNDFGPTS